MHFLYYEMGTCELQDLSREVIKGGRGVNGNLR